MALRCMWVLYATRGTVVEKEGKETVADTDHLAPRIDEPQVYLRPTGGVGC
jgi:hypothetical protein